MRRTAVRLSRKLKKRSRKSPPRPTRSTSPPSQLASPDKLSPSRSSTRNPSRSPTRSPERVLMGVTLADFSRHMILDVCNLLVSVRCPTQRDWHAFGGLMVLHGFGSPVLVGQDQSARAVKLRNFEDMLRLVCKIGTLGYFKATTRPAEMRLTSRDITPPRARTDDGSSLADVIRSTIIDACNRVVAAPSETEFRKMVNLLRDESISYQLIRREIQYAVRVEDKASFRRLLCKARPVIRLQ